MDILKASGRQNILGNCVMDILDGISLVCCTATTPLSGLRRLPEWIGHESMRVSVFVLFLATLVQRLAPDNLLLETDASSVWMALLAGVHAEACITV